MGMEGDAHMSLAQAGGQWKYTPAHPEQPGHAEPETTFDEHDGQWRPLSGTDSRRC